MTLILGIDPGAHGAFALYETTTRELIDIEDMPSWFHVVGKAKRARVDEVRVAEMFAEYHSLGVALCVIEKVGGRPKQSASGGFVFGYSVGLLHMAATIWKIPIEAVAPGTWKQLMGVPGKQKADDTAIIQRADQIFPNNRDDWRGPRGGKMVDRAEAAMLAKFGGDTIYPKINELVRGDLGFELAYNKGTIRE